MRGFSLRTWRAVGLASSVLLAGCCRARVEESTAMQRAPTTKGETSLDPSCAALDATCGPNENEDCCENLLVPGGSYLRSFDGIDYLDKRFPATVSHFYLDTYEITVARFRSFVAAGKGTQKSPPEPGSGAHPKIPGSGWKPAYDLRLPTDSTTLRDNLACFSDHSWTDSVGANEHLPINCLDWYMTFAFCIWDGKRLPTEAEWNYAASGGSEHRYFPWSTPPDSTLINDSLAVYCDGEKTCGLQKVGSRSPRGDGRWEQADLGGNVWEWTLDSDSGRYVMPCEDCAVVDDGAYRAFRSGSNDDLAPTLRSATRHVYYPDHRGNIGGRCARSH